MPRSRSHTRRTSRSNPRGVLSVSGGGFGFVQTAEGAYFIPSAKMAGAFDGDLVEVAPLPDQKGKGARGRQSHERVQSSSAQPGDQPAARVLRIIDRAHDTVIGRYEVAEPFGVVVPENTRIPYDIFTMRADHLDVPDGALVRVRITAFPSRNTAATGVVEEVIAQSGDEDTAIDLIVARHKLETRFSEGALEEARVAVLDETGAFAQGYRDLRERFVCTIDPTDARDFDDALSLDALDCSVLTNSSTLHIVDKKKPLTVCWRLGVHIADVSHYVSWNSALDLDARRRATSVYLADRVIPMLPEELSGDLCSLRPHEVRRTMTADLYLDKQARLVAYELYPALICSNERLTYDEALKMLTAEESRGLDASVDSPDSLTGRLRELAHIAKLRAAARETAGGLDFASVEAKVRLDDEGHPIAIDLRRKTDATSLVEEAMILANETVARHMRDLKFPSIYRVHEKPAADSLAGLLPVLQEFSWFKDVDQWRFVSGDSPTIQYVLAASKGRVEEELVSSLVLRAMKRAVYRFECQPHYGLASEAYTHFTSPIRRYPDLVVHRMLKAQWGRRPEKFDQETSNLPWISEHSSDMERVAEKAGRESQEVKIVEYMERSIGQAFSAVVSGVTAYGLYVRLDNTAEGLVHAKDLGDEYFAFDPTLHRLMGQDTGMIYRLGQRVPVVLTAADIRSARLDFRLVR